MRAVRRGATSCAGDGDRFGALASPSGGVALSARASALAATQHLRRRQLDDDDALLFGGDATLLLDDETSATSASSATAGSGGTCFRGFQIGHVYHYDWKSELNVEKVAIHQTTRQSHKRDLDINLKVR